MTEQASGTANSIVGQVEHVDLIVRNITALYTLNPNSNGARGNLGLIYDGCVAFRDHKICYLGPSECSTKFVADRVVDGSGTVGLPGLVDCHTHSVWAGSRADEFARRLAGESYVSTLEKGGGIHSTVHETREASLEELAGTCRRRLENMRNSCGVTTVEIKSGYGLDADTELKMLKAAHQAADGTVRSVRTFLGAHVIPKEFKNDREGYITDILNNQLPACRPFADCVDVFCDRGAFTVEEARKILVAGKNLGMTVRAHAEQIESTGCAKLVSELGGSSADHLEQLDQEGVDAMAANDVVAVLLPGAQLYLKDIAPPVQKLREANVKMAVATDLNPGSSPVHSLWTAATLGCILQGLTVEEAVKGITRNAGLALQRPDLGWLASNGESVADLVLFSPPPGEEADVAALINQMGGHKPETVIIDGRVVFQQAKDTSPSLVQ